MARKDKGQYTGKRVLDGVEYDVIRIPAEEQPDYNTFDRMWTPGVLPAWIRKRGHTDSSEDERMFKPDYIGTTHVGESYEEPTLPYQNRPAAEEPYVDALKEFFADRIALWPGTLSQKGYLDAVMNPNGRSQHDIAKDEGVSQAAISQGISRALESFVKWAGGKAALAEALRQYLVDREAQDGRDRLKYLPRWVHG